MPESPGTVRWATEREQAWPELPKTYIKIRPEVEGQWHELGFIHRGSTLLTQKTTADATW